MNASLNFQSDSHDLVVGVDLCSVLLGLFSGSSVLRWPQWWDSQAALGKTALTLQNQRFDSQTVRVKNFDMFYEIQYLSSAALGRNAWNTPHLTDWNSVQLYWLSETLPYPERTKAQNQQHHWRTKRSGSRFLPDTHSQTERGWTRVSLSWMGWLKRPGPSCEAALSSVARYPSGDSRNPHCLATGSADPEAQTDPWSHLATLSWDLSDRPLH